MEVREDAKPEDGNNQQVSKDGIKSMLRNYKIKAIIGISLAPFIWLLGGFFLSIVFSLSENPTTGEIIGFVVVLVLGLIPFVYGCCCCCKAKGYPAAYGLFGFFGLAILACLRDKSKYTTEVHPIKPDVIYRKGSTKPKDEQNNK